MSICTSKHFRRRNNFSTVLWRMIIDIKKNSVVFQVLYDTNSTMLLLNSEYSNSEYKFRYNLKIYKILVIIKIYIENIESTVLLFPFDEMNFYFNLYLFYRKNF